MSDPMSMLLTCRALRYVDMVTLLVACRFVSRMFKAISMHEIQVRHHALFASFVDDVPTFLSEMQACRAVLGGSAALQFIVESFSDVGDYDIYVPLRFFDRVLLHLFISEGYTIQRLFSFRTTPRTSHDYCQAHTFDYCAGISRIATLRRGHLAIDIIASGFYHSSDSATIPLGYMWSTLTMNFIAPSGICIPYPTLTLSSQGFYHWPRILHFSFPTDATGTGVLQMNKYTGRGFILRRLADDFVCGGALCPGAYRYFGDRGCMILSFDGEDMVGLGTRWRFGGVACVEGCTLGADNIEPPSAVHPSRCGCL